MNTFYAAVIATAAFLLAFAVVWKAVRYIFRVDKAMPILLTIAEQFTNNGGSTLLDKVEEIDKKLTDQNTESTRVKQELEIQTRLAVKIAEDSRLIAQTNSKIVQELGLAQTDDIHHIKEYLHEKMHEVNNNLATTNLQLKVSDRRMGRLEERLDKMFPLINRSRKDDNAE